MKTRRFDFNFKPLMLQVSYAVEGSVPDKQNYSADTAEYTPDYTITPLVIQPNVSIIDKDGILNAGRVNQSLTNVRWYEIVNGTRTLISTTNTNYEVTATGGNAGRIKVQRNVEPKIPITLEFYAEYVDSRNSQVIVIRGTYMLECSSASDVVRVELDAAGQTLFNPLADTRSQTVTATVYVGSSKLTDSSKYLLTWEVMGEDNTWHEVGTDEVLDYDVTVNGNTATVDKWLMGTEMYLRCRCRYSAEGTPDTVELNDDTPYAMVSFVRRIPKYEYNIEGVPYNIPAGSMILSPTTVIRDTNGEISNPETELLPLWYMATNKASGSLSYVQVAQGLSPTIDTTLLDNNYGAVMGLDVVDRGYAGALTDGDGAVITDGDGAVMIIH